MTRDDENAGVVRLSASDWLRAVGIVVALGVPLSAGALAVWTTLKTVEGKLDYVITEHGRRLGELEKRVFKESEDERDRAWHRP